MAGIVATSAVLCDVTLPVGFVGELQPALVTDVGFYSCKKTKVLNLNNNVIL